MSSTKEQFALGPDRAAVLAQLVPGSADHVYYGTLHALNEGNLASAKKLLDEWRPKARSFGNNGQFVELESRYHLAA